MHLLKIAIVTNNYKPYSGGVVSSIESFANTLKQFGHIPYIITLDFDGNYREEENVFRISCPIKFTYKNNPMGIPWRADNAIYNLIKDLSPHIIHSQHPFLLGVSALKSCRKLSIPIVFTYHTRYEEYLHYIPLPEILTAPIVKSLAISYCNKTNGIIAPSNSMHQFLKESNLNNKELKVISSGILPVFNLEKFNNKKINNPFKLLTVSRFVKEKNIPFLLNVFKKLNSENFVFDLIGYGSELQFLSNYAYQKLGLSKEQVKFIEKPEKEIIAQYYKSSDLFIFSSVSETQGLVLAEAMAGGTPVIALNSPATHDIIQDEKNGFLVNSIDQMVEKIKLIYNNSELHKKMQQEAWLTAQNYNSINTTKSLIDFYNDVIRNY